MTDSIISSVNIEAEHIMVLKNRLRSYVDDLKRMNKALVKIKTVFADSEKKSIDLDFFIGKTADLYFSLTEDIDCLNTP